ncbi:MAG: asparagine synthase (glutamine-hydrolyzing) [Anaeroplasmataceae bacterium]
MCGILFKSNYFTNCDILKFKEALKTMTHRGPDECGLYFCDDYAMGHNRLAIRDVVNGHQPISILNHHLIYNGEIYNTEELNDILKSKVMCHSDSVILLKMLLEYNEKALEKINGIFGFVYVRNGYVLAARDKIGIKPLYYSMIDKDIIISSEIKAILKYKGEAIVDKNGLCELLGLLPSHSPGNTIYKGIYELKPGHYLTYDRTNGLKINKYYDLKPLDYNMSLEDTRSMVKHILVDAIRKQMVSDVPYCSFLSGGLDSSIIVGVMKEYKNNLNTFSITYEDNDKDFIKNEFETSSDEDYVKLLKTKHRTITIDNTTLIDYLKTAVVLRDGPGMVDIDASLYYLAKRVKEDYSVSMSGECSDEIFGGYPWYYKDDKYDIFPWIRNLDYRNELINKNLNIDIKDYVKKKYDEIIKETPVLKTDSEEKIKERQMYYLNVKYFMQSLIERHDRMTMGASLEVRVPFADYRLVDLLYNVPFNYKYYNNTEKALLRDSMKEYIPELIYNRKKSPYPKTRSKKYSKTIKKLLQEVLKDKNSILYTLFDSEKLIELANSNKELDTPWYGQLMRIDQLRAFLYQIDFWYKEYNIKLELS